MEKQLPKIKLDFLRQSSGIGGIREILLYGSSLLGINPKELLKTIRQREEISPLQVKIYRALATLGISNLYDAGSIIKGIYGFPNRELAMDKFLKGQEVARDVIETLIELYGLDKDRFGLKNEVAIADPSLVRMLAYLNPRPNELLKQGSSLRLRYEIWRELLLIDLYLRNSLRGMDEHPSSKLSELQQRFNTELFEGKAGEGNLLEYFFKTSSDGSVSKITRKRTKGLLTKIEEFRTIVIDGKSIPVQIDFSTKTPVSKIIKILSILAKNPEKFYDPLGFKDNGEPINLDRQRFQLVVYGSYEDIDKVHEKISGLFDTANEDEDNQDFRGQNPSYYKKFIVSYKGINLELIYYTNKGYLESQMAWGKLTPQTVEVSIKEKKYQDNFNIYNGSSHRLYEIRRSLHLLFLIFPYEVYKKPNQTPEDYINEMVNIVNNRSQQIVNELKKNLNKN